MPGIEGRRDDLPALHPADGLDEILMLIHERPDQAQFPILDEAHVDAGMIAIDADRHDRAALLDGRDGLGERRFDAGAFEGRVEALAAEYSFRGLGQRFPAGMGDILQPAAGRDLQPVFADVRDQDVGAAGPGGLADEVADRPAAQDGHAPAGQGPGPGRGVDGHGDGLDQGALFEEEGARQGDDLVRFRHEPLLGAAGGLEAPDLQDVADVVVAAAAGRASPADFLRRRGDLYSRFQAGDAPAQLFNDPGKFMALHDGIRREGMLAMVDVDVRTADADAPDPDEDLAPAGPGLGDVAELDRPRLRHDGLFHGLLPCGFARPFCQQLFSDASPF